MMRRRGAPSRWSSAGPLPASVTETCVLEAHLVVVVAAAAAAVVLLLSRGRPPSLCWQREEMVEEHIRQTIESESFDDISDDEVRRQLRDEL